MTKEILSPEDLADYAKAWGLTPGWPKHPPARDDQRTALARIIHSHERLRALLAEPAVETENDTVRGWRLRALDAEMALRMILSRTDKYREIANRSGGEILRAAEPVPAPATDAVRKAAERADKAMRDVFAGVDQFGDYCGHPVMPAKLAYAVQELLAALNDNGAV